MFQFKVTYVPADERKHCNCYNTAPINTLRTSVYSFIHRIAFIRYHIIRRLIPKTNKVHPVVVWLKFLFLFFLSLDYPQYAGKQANERKGPPVDRLTPTYQRHGSSIRGRSVTETTCTHITNIILTGQPVDYYRLPVASKHQRVSV